MQKKIIILTITLLFAAACSKISKVNQVNFAPLYNKTLNTLTPTFRFYHLNDSVSTIEMEIPSHQLLYVKDTREELYISKFKISYQTSTSGAQKNKPVKGEITFSDTLYFDDNRIVQVNFSVALMKGKKYEIYFKLEDLLHRTIHSSTHIIDKQGSLSYGFVKPAYPDGKKISGNPVIVQKGKVIQLSYFKPVNQEIMIGIFSFPDQTPPAAYVNMGKDGMFFENLLPDSVFSIQMIAGIAQVETTHQGVLRLFEPGNFNNGFAISVFYSQYPDLPKNEELLAPLRYITSIDEFRELFIFRDPQLASERFWQKSSGNPDRGQAQMNRFNTRVIEANRLFPSHLPGWKTDRGMVYIVVGVPDLVFRDGSKENWLYNETMSRPGANLTFVREENQFSSNHFVLQRKQEYSSLWNLSVAAWRR